MNIDEFISYKENCLVCGNKLDLYLIAKQLDIINASNFIEINLVVSNYLLSPEKKSTFTTTIKIDQTSNTFEVDFLDKYLKSLEAVSLKRMLDFQFYVENVIGPNIYKICECEMYGYSSHVDFEYKTSRIKIYQIDREFIICKNAKQHYNVFNNYFDGGTIFSVGALPMKHNDAGYISASNDGLFQTLFLPIIDIEPPKELMEKLDIIYTFS